MAPRTTLIEEMKQWRARILASCDSNRDLLAKCEVKDRAAILDIIETWSTHVVGHVAEGYDPKAAVGQVICWSLLLGGHLEREGLL